MADENEQRRLQPEAAGAPNRDKRGEPPIIEGEATNHDEAAAAASRERSDPEPPESDKQPVPPGDRTGSSAPHRQSWLFAAAALGGVVGAGAAAIVFWLGAVNADAGLSERIAAVDAPIADLGRRVSALESAAQNARASADAIKAAQSDSQAARSDAAKALALANKTAASVEQKANAAAASAADLNALDERVKKLESGPPPQLQQAQNGPELSSLEDRLAKVEAALAAPKNETRVAPENASARKDS